MSDAADYGITESDREKMGYMVEKGAPRGEHTLGSIFGETSEENTDPDNSETEPENEPKSDDDSDGRTETRERVLTGPEFERLLIGALRIDDDQRALESWCALVMLGRLGLRAGEFNHFSIEWYNRREQVLSIPDHDPCTNGTDGGPCGSCRQAAKQRIEHGDDRSLEEVAAEYWRPKTAAAVRAIPTHWSPRVEEAVLLLGQMHGEWPHSYSTLKRRLGSALENAPLLEGELLSLHGLRGTAASYHAGNGLEKEALKQMMGWRDDSTPQKYLSINGQMVRRALDRAYR